MRKFDGLDIELTRGDTLSFRVVFKGRDLPDTAIALFTIKKRPKDDEPAIVEKRLPIVGNKSTVLLKSEDTEKVKPRLYYWDIRVLVPEGDGTFWVKTPMEYAAFMLNGVVGDVSTVPSVPDVPWPPDVPDEPWPPDVPDEPDEPVDIELIVDNGSATLIGASLLVDRNGNGTLTGATLTVDSSGNGTIS